MHNAPRVKYNLVMHSWEIDCTLSLTLMLMLQQICTTMLSDANVQTGSAQMALVLDIVCCPRMGRVEKLFLFEVILDGENVYSCVQNNVRDALRSCMTCVHDRRCIVQIIVWTALVSRASGISHEV